MSEVTSTDKENQPDSPQKVTPHSSPVQANKMWDSNDPLRNPPPLPVSPQMLKIKSSNITSRSGSPNKLMLAQSDTELEFQLKKINESQTGLKKLVQSIDDSVKHTQIDLDNLVSRSSNNNSHLKDLLDNVTSSSKDHITEKQIEKILNDMISPVNEELSSLKKTIVRVIDEINSKREGTVMNGSDLLKSIHSQNLGLSEKLCQIETSQDKAQLPTLAKRIESNDQRLENIESIAKTSLKAVETISSELEQKLKELRLDSFFSESNENQKEILSTISRLSNQEELMTKFEDLRSILVTSNEQLDKVQESQIGSLKAQLKEHSATVVDLLSSSMKESFSTLNTKFSKLQSETSLHFESKINSELEAKNLEIQLKEKEIEELKNKLSEQSAKTELLESINALSTKYAKLETRYELLDSAYDKRYKEFQQLYNDHNELITKICNINAEKLTAVIGTATISNYQVNENESIASSPKKQVLSNRVMSNNSYLTNTNFGTPKKIKKYELNLAEADEDKENV